MIITYQQFAKTPPKISLRLEQVFRLKWLPVLIQSVEYAQRYVKYTTPEKTDFKFRVGKYHNDSNTNTNTDTNPNTNTNTYPNT